MGQAAKQSAEQLMQYEQAVAEAEDRLMHTGDQPKSVYSVLEHLKRFPITTATSAAGHTGLSFNSVSKAMNVMLEHDIIMQSGNSARNRIWIYKPVIFFTDALD